MLRYGLFAAAIILLLHGLIHLLGFVAYWPLGTVAELPYKTTLLGSRWDVGAAGMRLFAALWLAAAGGLLGGAAALLTGRGWWLPLLGAALALSLLVCVLDWANAYRGAVVSLLIFVPWMIAAGLRWQPEPFAPYPQAEESSVAVALPAGLPAPVARYYEAILRPDAPLVETAVITGRGTLRFAGLTFPARLRFTHTAGQGYRHYIEATLFGFPLLKVNERYLNGQARMVLPMGVIENEPRVNMAANLGLWGESIWLPTIYLTDPRVRWEGVDNTSARLIVPFEQGTDSFTVVFDPDTGLIQQMAALRYRDSADTEKIPWQLDVQAWKAFHGLLIPSASTVTWADEGSPWLIITVEDIAYNVDVGDFIRATGP